MRKNMKELLLFSMVRSHLQKVNIVFPCQKHLVDEGEENEVAPSAAYMPRRRHESLRPVHPETKDAVKGEGTILHIHGIEQQSG